MNVGDGLRLYPLGEFVHCYEQVSEAARALSEGSYHVEAPDYERPGDGDGLKLLCRQVHLESVELASLTPADDLLYDQRPRGHVMSTNSGMDHEEELLALVDRDTLHEYS